jgi:hypothetical protein
MKVLKADVAFAEPLLAKAMKANGVDKDFSSDLILMAEQQDKKRAKRMYETVQEAARTKREWVFAMPFHHPARIEPRQRAQLSAETGDCAGSTSPRSTRSARVPTRTDRRRSRRAPSIRQ